MSEAQNPLWAVVGNRGFEPSDRPVPWLFNHMSDAQGKADHLNRFDNTNQYYAAPVFVVRKEWVKAVQDRADLARAQVASVKVKPLVWAEESKLWIGKPATKLAQLAFWIIPVDGKFRWAGDEQRTLHPTLDAAKAAAQADYERRILGALDAPVDANALVAAAYEAAVQSVEPGPIDGVNRTGGALWRRLKHEADKVRALASADAKAALNAMLKAERVKAYERAAEIAAKHRAEYHGRSPLNPSAAAIDERMASSAAAIYLEILALAQEDGE